MKNQLNFVLGFVLGALIFGSTAVFAAGIIAQPKTATIVIDGKVADIAGYSIEGNHYFKLRDLDEKLMPGGKDFSVVWDSQNNRVIIDTSRRYDPGETLTTPVINTPAEKVIAAKEATMTTDEMRLEIVRLTNAERVNSGLNELTVLPELMDTAKAKAEDLIVSHYFDHVSPVYGTPGEMIKAAIPQVKSCGENLMSWTKTPEDAFAGWLVSPEHKKTMLAAKYTHIGVGIVLGADGGFWWVAQYAAL